MAPVAQEQTSEDGGRVKLLVEVGGGREEMKWKGGMVEWREE